MLRQKKNKKTDRPLQMEQLEAREVFSLGSIGCLPNDFVPTPRANTNLLAGADVHYPQDTSKVNWVKRVNGTKDHDIIKVTATGWNQKLKVNVWSYSDPSYKPISFLAHQSYFLQNGVDFYGKVFVYGYGGDDKIQISQGINFETFVYAGDGNDKVYSGATRSIIDGGRGNDILYGYLGNDVIKGGPGIDRLYGHGGHDRLYGGSETDYLYGGTGNDILRGGSSHDYLYGELDRDRLYGGSGNDVLEGGSHNDRLYGGSGSDELFGDSGNDWLWGGDQNDKLHGGSGTDRIWGDDGHDRLWGDDGNDYLYGGNGHDKLYAGAGRDYLFGGADNDILISIDNSHTDHLWGDSGYDSFWYDDNQAVNSSGSKSLAPGLVDKLHDQTWTEKNSNSHGVSHFSNDADKTLDGEAIVDPTFPTSSLVPGQQAYWDAASYASYSGNPLFASSGPSSIDVYQGYAMGDCWLLAALGSAAETNSSSIYQTIVELGDNTYGVSLGDQFYRIDADLPVGLGVMLAARPGQENSLWVPLVEKAYAFHRPDRLQDKGTYTNLDGGFGTEAFSALGATTNKSLNVNHWRGTKYAENLFAQINAEINAGNAVSVGTRNSWEFKWIPLAKKHAYMVDHVIWDQATGKYTKIVLRNPFGNDGRSHGGNHDANDDGFVTLSAKQFVTMVGRIDWANLI